MAGFNLADGYRAAGLSPAPDILRFRQEPFDKVLKSINAPNAIDLTRLYFGLELPDGSDWFRDAFSETDPSFSMYDNVREASVLAAGLLGAAILEGKVYAALAPLAAAAAGSRKPVVRPELIEEARAAISSKAVTDRQRKPANPSQMKLPGKSEIPNEAAALLAAPDWQKVGGLFTQVSEESNELTKNLTNQVFNVVLPLTRQVADLREEVDMLWWYIGGWSRLLECPFSDLEPALAAAMAGLDMADLSVTLTGPAAAPAILQRIISAGRKAKAGKVAIKDAVDAFPEGAFEQLELGDGLKKVPDICPILTAFSKAKEIGAGTAWHATFAKASGLNVTVMFQPIELAMQVYRERLLLSALN